MQFHVNGELVPESEASIPVDDRGFQYGDAAFETLRAYNGTLFEWEAHRARLEHSCAGLGMDDVLPADLHERIVETLEANDLAEAYVRASITRGIQPGTLTPQPEVEPSVIIVVKELPKGGPDGESRWDAPATVETVEVRKPDPEAIPPDLKTHNYLNGLLARLELREPDGSVRADEALLLDSDGFVAEGTTSNVFFVEDGVLHTTSLDGPILAGVTRSVVIELAEENDIPVETGRYPPERLREADELFLTNTTGEVWPVARLDDSEIGGGPITERLADRFDERVGELY